MKVSLLATGGTMAAVWAGFLVVVRLGPVQIDVVKTDEQKWEKGDKANDSQCYLWVYHFGEGVIYHVVEVGSGSRR